MTAPAPVPPGDREALAELVNGRPLPPNPTTVGAGYERDSAFERADQILARWRLVPVGQGHAQ